MRTPEQKVQFQLDRLNVADAATARAQRKVLEAHEKKASAIAYAATNVGHVERDILTLNTKLETARKNLAVSESKQPAAHEARMKSAQKDVAHAERHLADQRAVLARAQAAVVSSEEANARAEGLLSTSKRILASITACRDHKSDGTKYAQSQVDVFLFAIETQNVKLAGAKATLTRTIERYDEMIDAAVLVRDDFKRRQEAVQADYLEADDLVQHLAKQAHAETMRSIHEMKNEKTPEQRESLRKIAFEGGTNTMNERINT